MKQYLIKSNSQLATPAEDMSLPPLTEALGRGYIFHYHIYNVPVNQIENDPDGDVYNDCYHRVVFQNDPITSMRGIFTLWEEVVDKYHYYDKIYTRLLSFSSEFVASCTNCGKLDIIRALEECVLCNSPVCIPCYQKHNYCNDHLN